MVIVISFYGGVKSRVRVIQYSGLRRLGERRGERGGATGDFSLLLQAPAVPQMIPLKHRLKHEYE